MIATLKPGTTVTTGTLTGPATDAERDALAAIESAALHARRFRRATPAAVRAEIARCEAEGTLTASLRAHLEYLLDRS